MKDRLLLLLLFLSVFFLCAQSKKHKKKHHKDRVEEIVKDYDLIEEELDDEDEDFEDWLLKLQGMKGDCNPNPCLNNGVCEEKKKGRFKCDCPKPFKGKRCEKAKKVCKRRSCGRGQCVVTSVPPYYECKCKAPFLPPDCRKTSPCVPNPCQNNGKCIKDGDNFECLCSDDFTGKYCDVDPDDCYEDDGQSYRGKVSETEDGVECVFWNSHFLLDHGIDPFNTFEDSDGLGRHNYCRNPDGDTKPWCFTKRGKRLRWEYCDVEECLSPTVNPSGAPSTASSAEPPTSGPGDIPVNPSGAPSTASSAEPPSSGPGDIPVNPSGAPSTESTTLSPSSGPGDIPVNPSGAPSTESTTLSPSSGPGDIPVNPSGAPSTESTTLSPSSGPGDIPVNPSGAPSTESTTLSPSSGPGDIPVNPSGAPSTESTTLSPSSGGAIPQVDISGVPDNASSEISSTNFTTCGKPKPKRPINRIYGGLKVISGARPWQVSMQVRPKGSTMPFRHTCGGTLIKSCWVLTAGHCIDKLNEIQVMVGGVDLGKYEKSEQVLKVEEAILHEKFKETRQAVFNDIALLRLKGDDGVCAKETQFVKVACLPDEPFPDGSECAISGWGSTEDSKYGSSQLLDAEVLLISQDVCTSPQIYGNSVDDSMFCAGYMRGGVDSCQGDSGGPLTCEKEMTHYIYGIVSWGDSCGKKNKPGVYTSVTHFLDWIKAKTGG